MRTPNALLILVFVMCMLTCSGLRIAPTMSFNLDRVLYKVSSERLLTKTAQLGLLSKLDKAGVKLTTLAPLVLQTEKLDVLGVAEVSADKILPLISLAVDQAPALLPLVGTVLKAGPAGLLVLAGGSAAAAAATIFLIPDDSIANVALQTFAAIPLGAIVPGACVVGAGVLNKLK